jgi:hypothetical protein
VTVTFPLTHTGTSLCEITFVWAATPNTDIESLAQLDAPTPVRGGGAPYEEGGVITTEAGPTTPTTATQATADR